jgi:hypothetical protein
MIERENGQLPLAKRTIRSRISSERWEQIKVAYVSGIGLREIARKMNIPEGTVLAHAKRHGWTQQIQVATQQQSDAITPMQSVPQSIAQVLAERKDRTRLGLSQYAAEAAEQAAEHRDKLGIAGKVRDVSAIHSSLWPEESSTPLIDGGILIGTMNVIDARSGYVESGPDKGKFFPVDRDQEGERKRELPSPVFEENEKVKGASSPVSDCDATNPIRPSPPKPDNTRVTVEDPSRSAYREKCKYWRRHAHATW